MKTKKIITVLLSLILVMGFALTGCSGGDKESNNDNQPTKSADTSDKEDDVKDEAPKADKIVIFQSKVEITDQLEAAAKAYTEETGVEVEVWGTTGDDYLQQLKIWNKWTS